MRKAVAMLGDSRAAHAGHTLEERTGEPKLRIEASTLPGILAAAGRALAEAMGAPLSSGPLVERRIGVVKG